LTLLKAERLDLASNEHLLQTEAAVERISAMIRFTKEYEDIGVRTPIWQDVDVLVKTASTNASLEKTKVVNDIPSGTEVFADPLIIKVFQNLIQNSVRHGGKITTIWFHVEDVDGAPAIICEDDGDGISPDLKQGLFTRGFGKDHGLGLFLSREILSITGITIAEMGEPGHGAKFVMTVPSEVFRVANH
jgi:signal transduction histidine kinase